MRPITFSDFLIYTTAVQGIIATVVGVIACPLYSLALTQAFVWLSLLTLVCLIATLVRHMFLPTPYKRVLRICYGIVPFVLLWVALLAQSIQKVREGSARLQQANHAKNIGMATHEFHEANKRLPTDVHDAAGKPVLSWRVNILPFVDQAPLFGKFDLTQPWDSPQNRGHVEKMPWCYGSLTFPGGPGETPWQGFVGPGTAFDPARKGLKLADDFPDGPGNTILFVEALRQVPWSKPADIPYATDRPLPPLGQDRMGTANWPFCCPVRIAPSYMVCMGDATVRMFSADMPEETLRALIVRNDGKQVELPE